MNQLKQKIIEIEKEIKDLINGISCLLPESKQLLEVLDIIYEKKITLSALKLAEEIQNENVKKLKEIIEEFAFGDKETNIEVSRELIKKIKEVFE